MGGGRGKRGGGREGRGEEGKESKGGGRWMGRGGR